MKRILIVLMCASTLSTFGQNGGKFNNTDLDKIFKGYMVNEKHDTIKGSFKIYTQDMMQQSCLLIDNNGNQLYGNSWNNVICYKIENNTVWYSTKFTNLKAPADAKRLGDAPETFLNVVEEGPITMFEYNFVDRSANPVKNDVKTYLQLMNGEVVDASSLLLGFKNKMSGYVKDYPDLATKISNKEKGYGLLNINSIIREYNTWYLAKSPGFSILKK